jgi:hypothetical protein
MSGSELAEGDEVAVVEASEPEVQQNPNKQHWVGPWLKAAL